MKQRLRIWLDDTHGTTFELMRHFLGTLLNGGSLVPPGGWPRLVSGALAIVVSLWVLFLPVLIRKYGAMRRLGLHDRLPQEFYADLATLSLLCVLGTMLFAGLLWQSLYPERRDYSALAGYPLHARELFVARFLALVLLFALFLALVAGQAAAVLYAVAGGPELPGLWPIFRTLVELSVAAFFGLVAAQGLLLLLPRRGFQITSALAQAVTIGGAVVLLPLAGRVAPVVAPWFSAFSAREWYYRALIPAIAVLTYVLSYHRYRRLEVESPQPPPGRDRDLADRFFDRWLSCSREHAAFLFMGRTLLRSQSHRLACLIGVTLAVAWVASNAADFMDSTRGSQFARAYLGSAPLTLLIFMLIGARRVFSLPAELGANWLFQMTERDGRLAWMKAVERFVVWIGIVPLVLASAVVVARFEGVHRAAAWTILMLAAAGIAFDYLFRDWRKLPFTCSRVASRQPLIMTVAIGLGLMTALLPFGYLILSASARPASFLIALASAVVAWRLAHRSRMSNWGVRPLRFEEEPDNGIESLQLSQSGAVHGREEFRRVWSKHAPRDSQTGL